MGYDSEISWTHHTFNPWIGCAKVSAGCKHCYAETLMDTRYGRVEWGPNGTRQRTSAANWRKPLAWNREAAAKGIRYRVFCASLADVFEDRAELIPWRADLFDLIEQTPALDWLLLTKRPENVNRMVADYAGDCYWLSHNRTNIWIGTSAEDQENADVRVPHLLNIPAAVRFLSMEPLLGPVDLRRFFARYRSLASGLRYTNPVAAGDFELLPGIDWVIVGGESGPGARPMHPDWARSLRDQCQAASIAFHFKQHGHWIHESQVWENPGGPFPAYRYFGARKIETRIFEMAKDDDFSFAHQFPDASLAYPVGKALAGRHLDGRTWDEFPGAEVPHAS